MHGSRREQPIFNKRDGTCPEDKKKTQIGIRETIKRITAVVGTGNKKRGIANRTRRATNTVGARNTDGEEIN